MLRFPDDIAMEVDGAKNLVKMLRIMDKPPKTDIQDKD